MNLNVEVELHNAFKAVTAQQGKNMTDVILQFIELYVAEHQGKSAGKRGRR